MGKESHYSSKKDRIFVRGIQGQYSLKDELKRRRAMPSRPRISPRCGPSRNASVGNGVCP